jgi:hypothetical protein
MSPFTHDVLRYGLIAVIFTAMGIGAWANGRMMRRFFARRSELGNAWFDLRPTFAALNGIEHPIFIAAVLAVFAAAYCLKVLG